MALPFFQVREGVVLYTSVDTSKIVLTSPNSPIQYSLLDDRLCSPIALLLRKLTGRHLLSHQVLWGGAFVVQTERVATKQRSEGCFGCQQLLSKTMSCRSLSG